MLRYIFCCTNCSSFGHWVGSSCWLLCPFDISASFWFLCASLDSASIGYSRLILYISCPRISNFSNDPQFLLLENGTRNPDLGTRWAHWCWSVIASRPFQQTELRNVCVCVYVCVNVIIKNFFQLFLWIFRQTMYFGILSYILRTW